MESKHYLYLIPTKCFDMKNILYMLCLLSLTRVYTEIQLFSLKLIYCVFCLLTSPLIRRQMIWKYCAYDNVTTWIIYTHYIHSISIVYFSVLCCFAPHKCTTQFFFLYDGSAAFILNVKEPEVRHYLGCYFPTCCRFSRAGRNLAPPAIHSTPPAEL